MKRVGPTALVLFACLLPCFAQTAPAWHAQWIGTAATDNPSNSWTVFRHSFDLPDRPASAVARIAVDSKYWLWINGEPVVFEGGLKRGPNPQDTYYDEVDLAPWLRKEKNTIAVLAWFWGKDGFSHKNSGQAGLLFEMVAGNTLVRSDLDWKALRHPAYSTPAGEQPNFRLAEGNIRFDARFDPGNWQSPGFDDSTWTPAHEFGTAGSAPWHKLHPRPIPQWENYGLKNYVNAADLPKISDGKPIVARLPYNAQITPALSIEAPSGGGVIDIRTDNYQDGNAINVRAEYVTRPGPQTYESLGWMNGHAVIYTIPAGVKILSLSYRETGYATRFSGAFSCDDPFYNTLWEKARRTLYVTMRDNYMDCPDRERAQWWGDAVNEIGESFYALSPSSSRLARKAIYELCDWQRPDKTLFSPVPAGNWDKELPTQMLASIGEYGFWTYYLNSGDRQTAVDAYPHVRDYLSLWKLDAQGLVIHRSGGWNWADWGENADERALDQAWYCLALQGAAKLARLAGRPEEATAYENTRNGVIAATNRTLWTGSAYRTPAYKYATDDRANALCVVAGIADSSRFPAIREILTDSFHASPYMEKYVLEALLLMKAPDAALARMKNRFGSIVASSWTTLPELWQGGTNNHAWSGGPLTILSQYFAGLSPLEPGWKTYQVRPQMGSLREIDATVDTASGLISVSLRRKGQSLSLTLKSPPGTTAIVCLPVDLKNLPHRVTVNDRVVWMPGQTPGKGGDVIFKEAADDTLRFSTSPGTWVFRVKP